jgi:CheY-like chemotaxis protein
LEAVSRLKPDVLVSDIAMPLEDGYSLFAKSATLGRAGGRDSAIALTAYARAEDRMKAIAAGFQMHISKPVEPAETSDRGGASSET